MSKVSLSERIQEMLDQQPAMQASHERSTREALLEHARMGRSDCEEHDGKIIWLTPEQIFARYGLDEFGRPRPQ